MKNTRIQPEALPQPPKAPELWICGQKYDSADQNDRCWEFQGVFDSERKAVQACAKDDFFIFPALLNEEVPAETLPPAEGYYYPRLETKDQGLARARKEKEDNE